MTDPMLVGPAVLAMKRAREANDVDDLGPSAAAGPVKRRRTMKAGSAATKAKAPSSAIPAGTPAQANVQLVPVSGNPKVDRCLRCRSFVSKRKNHGLSECDAVLRNKANPQRRASGSGKFRMTPKRRSLLMDILKDVAKGRLQEQQIERKFKSLSKWVKKNDDRGKLSKRSKEMLANVIAALDVDYNSYNKKLSALRRKVGL